MTTSKKLVIAIVALSLALVCVVGGTLAYLFDVTDKIENVFNPQNIDVDLTETPREYNMVPGVILPKDPKVTIDSDIAGYVFVEITVANNVWNDGTKDVTVVDWAVADGWTIVPGTTNVYYREVGEGTNTFSVLKDDQVKVSVDVTKEYMDGLEKSTIVKPTLTFKAYATQLLKEGTTNFEPAEAWEIAKGGN